MDGLFNRVLRIVEEWIPKKAYGHERKFKKELRDYLSDKLNKKSTGGFGSNRTIPVKTERGRKIKADILVGAKVPIELKRDLKKGQWRTLHSEIEDYLDEFRQVIVVICGVKQEEVLERLKSKYESQSLGFNMERVNIIVKRKENYGKEPEKGRRRGIGFGLGSQGPGFGNQDFGF